jgi:hypothetical protein
MGSTQADNSSRKLRLRCGFQFPWCALVLIRELYATTAGAEERMRMRGSIT